MNTMAVDFGVRKGRESRSGVEPRQVRRYARPLPLVAGLPEPLCARDASRPAARKVRSFWIPLEEDRLGEKLLFLALAGAAVFAIVQAVSFLMDYVENSALIHQAMARLLQS